jgi:hypothetical protein
LLAQSKAGVIFRLYMPYGISGITSQSVPMHRKEGILQSGISVITDNTNTVKHTISQNAAISITHRISSGRFSLINNPPFVFLMPMLFGRCGRCRIRTCGLLGVNEPLWPAELIVRRIKNPVISVSN